MQPLRAVRNDAERGQKSHHGRARIAGRQCRGYQAEIRGYGRALRSAGDGCRQVLGGAPGTRETDLLAPHNTVQAVDAIVLSGGSAFGLDAASGVQAALREMGRGFAVGPHRVPIVPAAILFDLANGGDKDWGRYAPYRDLGYQAARAVSADFGTGSTGAGTGALTATFKGGLGSASTVLSNGITVGALVAVNAIGSATVGDTRHFWAAPFEMDDEFGGLGQPTPWPQDAAAPRFKFRERQASATNTTIAVIATDALLTKAEAKRLAIAAHDGFSRALWPSHTPLDGDLVFALSTGTSGRRHCFRISSISAPRQPPPWPVRSRAAYTTHEMPETI